MVSEKSVEALLLEMTPCPKQGEKVVLNKARNFCEKVPCLVLNLPCICMYGAYLIGESSEGLVLFLSPQEGRSTIRLCLCAPVCLYIINIFPKDSQSKISSLNFLQMVFLVGIIFLTECLLNPAGQFCTWSWLTQACDESQMWK